MASGCENVPSKGEAAGFSLQNPAVSSENIGGGLTAQSTTSGATSSSGNPAAGPSRAAIESATLPDEAAAPISAKAREKLLFAFVKGTLLEEQEAYDEAGELYQEVAQMAPNSSYAYALAAGALLQADKVDEAIDMAQKALKNNAGDHTAHKVLGRAYIIKQQWPQAIEHYQKAIALNSQAIDAMEDLAMLYIQQRRVDEAIKIYRQLIYADPSQAVLYHFKIASWLYQLRRYEEALAEYETLAEMLPHYYEVHYKIGNIHEVLNHTKQSIQAYEKALDSARNSNEELTIRERLGSLYRSQRQFDQALSQYQKIVELDLDNQDAKKFLALLYVERGNYAKAYEVVDQLVHDHVVDFRIHLLQREVLSQLGREQEAYETFLKAFKRSLEQQRREDNFMFLQHFSQEDTLLALRQHHLLDDYRQMLVPEDDDWLGRHPRFLIANASLALFEHDSAQIHASLRRLIDSMTAAAQNENLEWVENLCAELRIWPKVRRAFADNNLQANLVKTFKQVLTIFPQEANILRTLGAVYIDNRQWEKAESVLTKAKDHAIPQTTAYQQLLFQLALVYEKQSRLADVEAVMQEAIERNPDNPQAYNFLGYTFADHNAQLEEAMKLVEKAVKMSPDDGNIIDSLGWVYYRMGRNQEAIHFLEEANEKEPNHPVILDHLGDAYRRAGSKTKALHFYREALKYGPDYPFEFTPDFKQNIQDKIQELETPNQP